MTDHSDAVDAAVEAAVNAVTPKFPEVVVPRSLMFDNAFMVLGTVQRELKAAGATPEQLAQFMDEATSGDNDHLVGTVEDWVEVA